MLLPGAVHGRDNYKRISVVVLYMLYKNAFLVTSLFLYGVFTGFTGQFRRIMHEHIYKDHVM